MIFSRSLWIAVPLFTLEMLFTTTYNQGFINGILAARPTTKCCDVMKNDFCQHDNKNHCDKSIKKIENYRIGNEDKQKHNPIVDSVPIK